MKIEFKRRKQISVKQNELGKKATFLCYSKILWKHLYLIKSKEKYNVSSNKNYFGYFSNFTYIIKLRN